ncbi:MAG: hypothetical protein IBX55_20250 [Methyloprofundus sp.]|nr:hypothetical protein [Methyloprofundus sp.]
MNRWSEAFDNHVFHTDWNSLVATLESIKLGAESDENVITEFVRFEKVANLIISILESIDRDTFHLQTLKNAQPPVQQSLNHLGIFKNNTSDLSQIQAANNNLDLVLNSFRSYMVMPDAVAKGIKSVSKSQEKLLEQLKSSLIDFSQLRTEELKQSVSDAHNYLEAIESDANKSGQLYSRLFGEDGDSGLNAEIKDLYSDIESIKAQSAQINQTIQELESQSTQSQTNISELEETAKKNTDEIAEMLADTEKELDLLKAFYLKVFGKPNEEGENIGGMKSELEEYKKAFNHYEKEHKSRIEELIIEIEGLLPGAVSAGLASEYKRLKDECAEPIKKFTRQFYLALVGLLIVGGFSFYYSVTNNSSLENILQSLLQVSPLLLPAIWFAVFTSRRRNEFERLRQEYAHKQAVTSSYQSFKEQIDRLGANQPEMLTALMNTAIKTIGDNASKIFTSTTKESSPIHEVVSATGQLASRVTKGSGKEATK